MCWSMYPMYTNSGSFQYHLLCLYTNPPHSSEYTDSHQCPFYRKIWSAWERDNHCGNYMGKNFLKELLSRKAAFHILHYSLPTPWWLPFQKISPDRQENFLKLCICFKNCHNGVLTIISEHIPNVCSKAYLKKELFKTKFQGLAGSCWNISQLARK